MAAQKGIYKRGNVYWIRYVGLDGRMHLESSGSKKLREAQVFLTTRKNAVLEGKVPEVKKITNHFFRELAVVYTEWMEARHKSAKLKKYLIGQLLEKFGNIPLRRITPALLTEFQTDYLNRGLKNSSVNKKVLLFKAMIVWATENGMVERDISDKLKKVKALKDDSKRIRFLTVEENKILVDACGPHYKPVIIIALATGMRKSNVLRLRWDEVDLEHGYIFLTDTKNGERIDVPIAPMLKKLIEDLPHHDDCPYIFPNPKTKKPYTSWDKEFTKAKKNAGLTDFHFHDLRHTYASHLVMSGVDLTTLMHLLGHKSTKMTLRYSHLAPSHKAKAMTAIEDKFHGIFGESKPDEVV